MEDKNIKIKFTDIVGYEMEKESLKEKVILPILYPILFQGKRAPQTNTVLYGLLVLENLIYLKQY